MEKRLLGFVQVIRHQYSIFLTIKAAYDENGNIWEWGESNNPEKNIEKLKFSGNVHKLFLFLQFGKIKNLYRGANFYILHNT